MSRISHHPRHAENADRGRELLLAAVVIAAVLARPGVTPAEVGRVSTDQPQIARGRYLANDVAMCVQCHTPRSDRGELDVTRLFGGAPVPVASPFAHRQWAVRASAIAGLPGWTDADAITLLTTGRRASGTAPSPPMPTYRLTHEDAAAVVAYLRSLGAR